MKDSLSYVVNFVNYDDKGSNQVQVFFIINIFIIIIIIIIT